jgi:ABC-type uncharacterized transport system ATPase subunit
MDLSTPPPPFIETLRIEGYGCIREASFELSRLHAFVGPNDSGKSTILRAVETVLVVASGNGWQGLQRLQREHRRWSSEGRGRLLLGVPSLALEYGVFRAPNGQLGELLRERGAPEVTRGFEAGDTFARAKSDWFAPPVLLRLDPDALRKPHGLIPPGEPLRFIDEHGTGLPGVLDGIRDRDEGAYAALRERLLALFPLVKRLGLRATSDMQKSLEIELRDGRVVDAELMSEGMLYFLAFLAAVHAQAARVLLVEEPENGLHPTRIAEVMAVLREVSKTTQVLIATHSPLVVNELGGDEVTVVTRDAEHGTRGVLLAKTPGYEKRAKVYANGELWVSYANGIDEAPLLEGLPRP